MADSQPKSLFQALGSKAYDRALSLAHRLLEGPKQLLELVTKVRRKAAARLKRAGQSAFEHTTAGSRLLSAYASGNYRDIAAENLVLLIAAFAYFLAPFDAIPDVFLTLGLADDIALLTWTFNKLSEELERFRAWEQTNTANHTDGDVIDVTDYKAAD